MNDIVEYNVHRGRRDDVLELLRVQNKVLMPHAALPAVCKAAAEGRDSRDLRRVDGAMVEQAAEAVKLYVEEARKTKKLPRHAVVTESCERPRERPREQCDLDYEK